MSNVPVIKFLFKSEWKILTEALNLNPIYESVELGSANDLSTYLSGISGGLVVTSLRDKSDLLQLATFIKQIKRNQSPPYVKVFVINFTGDKQFERAVGKLGILDIIEDKIQTKALKFKIDFMMKSVNAQVKKHAQVQTNAAIKSLENGKIQDKKVSDNSPVWEEALDCEDDIWLLKYEQDCKKILTRWLVKLMGPSPYVAQWVDSGTPGVWKFEFKGENEFIYGKGHWYYRGDQKPDFIWSENIWSFTGSAFDLFYQDGDRVASRLKLKDKVLTMAKNSDYAKTKDKSIIESFDKDLVFKKEGMAAGEAAVLDKDADNFQYLEGKGKTDSLQQGPLSGKGRTSHLNTDPLSLDLKPGESRNSSFWKGKNETAQDGKSDALSTEADQKTPEGAELGMENKGQHQKYYKNHNEAEKFEAKDIGHVIKKDGVSDNLKGKSSTDEIEGHLTSPDVIKKEKADRERKKEELSGKSATDKLPGHLSSEKKHAQSSPEESESNVDRSEEKTKSAKEESKKDLTGKSTTDKLPGHLSSQEKHNKSSPAKEESKKDLTGKSAAVEEKKSSESMKYLDQDNEKFEETGTRKDLQELKEALNSFKKSAPAVAGKGKGGTDQISTHYTSKKSDQAENEPAEPAGKVLPFASSNKALEAELAEAVMTAKVTSYLIQDAVKVQCQLDDHFDQTIIFLTNEPGLDATKTVMLNLNFNYMNKDTNLKFNGNVMQIDSDGEGAHYVTVEISKENLTAFNSFMKLYTTRQNNINLFLKTAKGH